MILLRFCSLLSLAEALTANTNHLDLSRQIFSNLSDKNTFYIQQSTISTHLVLKMQFSYRALVLVALSLDCAVASPARHRHSHQKRDASPVDFNDKSLYKGVGWNKDVDWNKVSYNGAAPAAAPAAADSPAASPSPSPAPSVPENKAAVVAPASSSVSATSSAPAPAQPSHSETASGGSSTSGFGGRTEPKDGNVPADRVGNLGIPYGSNMKKISESEVASHKYTNLISNTGSAEITVIVWNKACPDGNVAGWSCPNMKLQIPAGGKQALAFDEDSQGGLSLDCGTDPARGGVPNCPWGEFDFGNKKNNGWSGYDRSSIPVDQAGTSGKLTMSSQSGVESSKEKNSFTDVSQTHAGGELGSGPAHMTTEF